MANAKKLPSGNWRVQVYAGRDASGKRIYQSFTASTRREAERMAANWNAERGDRLAKVTGCTVDEAIQSYIDTCRATGGSPSTLAAYDVMRRNAYPLLASVSVTKLSLAMIQAQIDARAESHAPKTIRNELGLLRAAVSRHRKDLVFDDLILPKRKRREMSIPTDEQVQTLLSATSDADEDMFIAISLAAVMGLRRSEICALTMDDVDASNQTMHICKAMVTGIGGKLHVKPPKTEAGDRVLPIPDALYAQLTARRSSGEKLVNLSPNVITERYAHLCDRLGVVGSFHALRHYHASIMIAVGAPEKYIVADMGHSTFDMVRQVYGHVMAEKKRELMTGLANHADKIFGVQHEKQHDL